MTTQSNAATVQQKLFCQEKSTNKQLKKQLNKQQEGDLHYQLYQGFHKFF